MHDTHCDKQKLELASMAGDTETGLKLFESLPDIHG